MKKLNAFFCYSALLLLLLFAFNQKAAATQEYFVDGIVYTVNNNCATVSAVIQKLEGAVTVPDTVDGFSVTAIGEKAFFNQNKITQINLPETVKIIEEKAFSGCTKLNEIDLADITQASSRIFENCFSLSQVTVPDTLVKADVDEYYQGVFADSSVEKIIFEKGISVVPDYLCSGAAALKAVVLPEGVTHINSYAFYGCVSIEQILIPEGVEYIGKNAFDSCGSITEISFPVSLIGADEMSFANCTSLSDLNLGKVKEIGVKAFYNCTSLREIAVPYELSECEHDYEKYGPFTGSGITKAVFCGNALPYILLGCESLERVVLCEKTKVIGEGAFRNCSKLKVITFNDALNSIADKAFYNCVSLESIELPESVTSVGSKAFAGCCELRTVNLNKVLSLGTEVFRDCEKLLEITLPCTLKITSVSLSDRGALWGSGVKRVIFQSGTVLISKHICSGCEELRETVIPESVKLIESRAFYSCTKLKKVNFTGTQTQWLNIMFDNNNDELLLAEICFEYDDTGCEHSFTRYVYDNNATYISDGTKTACCDKGCGRKKTVIQSGTRLLLLTTSKLIASSTSGTATLKWNAVKGASGYRVFVRNLLTGKWNIAIRTTGKATVGTVKGLHPGTRYTFAVRPYVNTGDRIIWSDTYTSVSVYTLLPSIYCRVLSSKQNRATIAWAKSNGATGYQVWYSETEKGGYKKLSNFTNNSTYQYNLESGKTYYYRVRAYRAVDGGYIYSAWSSVESIRIR